MKSVSYKQLIRMALLTAPLIAIIYVTPIYILGGIKNVSYFVMLPLFTLPILLAWFLNIGAIYFINKPWVQSYWRTIAICALMYVVSGIILRFVHPPIVIAETGVTLIRVVNILSVNTIIYVLIDRNFTKEHKSRIELENANLKIATLEAEFKSLKDQINPHFLFNALSTAKALVKQQPQLAEDYLLRLSDFLRASINNENKTISLKEEIRLCKDFISLNQIRFGNALQAEYDLPADISNAFVPYFAIVSLFENAIKHNALTTESPLKISVKLSDHFIEIKNNRNTKFAMEAPSKTGLQNLKERYKLISGKEIVVGENEKEFIVIIPVLSQ